MKVLRAVFVSSLLAMPALAVAQDVKVDFDKAYDFSTVKTFAIKIGTTWGNEITERRVLTEFTDEIVAKGWKVVPEAQANVLVILHGASQTKQSASTFYTGMGGYYGYRGWGGGMGTAQTVVNEYRVGTLVVDMFDGQTKGLVFRGTAEDELSDNPDRNQKKLEKASAKMFKEFPPVAKK